MRDATSMEICCIEHECTSQLETKTWPAFVVVLWLQASNFQVNPLTEICAIAAVASIAV